MDEAAGGKRAALLLPWDCGHRQEHGVGWFWLPPQPWETSPRPASLPWGGPAEDFTDHGHASEAGLPEQGASRLPWPALGGRLKGWGDGQVAAAPRPQLCHRLTRAPGRSTRSPLQAAGPGAGAGRGPAAPGTAPAGPGDPISGRAHPAEPVEPAAPGAAPAGPPTGTESRVRPRFLGGSAEAVRSPVGQADVSPSPSGAGDSGRGARRGAADAEAAGGDAAGHG